MVAVSAVELNRHRPPGEPLTASDLRGLRYGGGTRELIDGVLYISQEPDGFLPDDLADLPEDGRRHELLDGVIIVSPSPRPRHQRAVARLLALLSAGAPPELEALPAPIDIHLAHNTTLEPDVVVVPRLDGDPERVARPLLVVEVLSPSTRHLDLAGKKRAYAADGIGCYWVVDPATPSLTVFELDGSDYAEVHVGRGSESVHVEHPFAVRLRPADLVD